MYLPNIWSIVVPTNEAQTLFQQNTPSKAQSCHHYIKSYPLSVPTPLCWSYFMIWSRSYWPQDENCMWSFSLAQPRLVLQLPLKHPRFPFFYDLFLTLWYTPDSWAPNPDVTSNNLRFVVVSHWFSTNNLYTIHSDFFAATNLTDKPSKQVTIHISIEALSILIFLSNCWRTDYSSRLPCHP